MIAYAAILNGALIDYNDWVVKQHAAIVGAPGDLRGIFYNKLISRLRDVYITGDLRAAIKPDHLIMSFLPRGYIASLSIVKERHAHSPTIRNEIFDGLDGALRGINVVDYQDKVSYELSKVIMDLKKSLNYGREQTADNW